jgi:uncharacterized protein YyaL (SSP411 family)
MTVHWQAWDDDVLRVAQQERRPVLLFITASWCHFCRDMAATTWADPEVAAAVAEHVIAVRVDKDDRPDIDARYGQGGWPSTVVLSPDGETLGGGTWLDPKEVVGLVVDAARRVRTEGPSRQAPRLLPRQPTGRLDASVLPAIEAALLAQFDARHGGFGTGQKFPHPEALDFAILRQSERGNPRLREVLEKTLTHMAEGGLHDHVEGGFFRFCRERDWRQPHTEKLLETQAGLARNYLEAGQLMQRRDFLEIGERTIDAMLRLFLDPEVKLCHSSLDADDEYYSRDAAGRKTRRRPSPDGRHLADSNARAVSALLKAGAVLRREQLTAAGLELAAALVSHLWRPGHGVSHSVEEGGRLLPGQLRDQAESARALLHVLQYTDDRRLAPALEDLLETIATEHVSAEGELVNRDEVAGPREAGRRDAAILDSAAAAEVLLRGALYSGRSTYALLARRALELHTEDFRRYGYAMSAYGRSVELIVHPPLHIVIVGAADDPRTQELFRNASYSFLPSRVVQRLDPALDRAHLERLELPVRVDPVVYVFLARDCAAEHTEAESLWAVLAAANARRLSG